MVAGVDMRLVDDAGQVQPWDGKSVGEIQVRGPWVTSGYYDNPAGAAQFTDDGWFRTGDVAAIDPEGYIQITDRTKDLIKSGGEWISSVDLESTIMGHPKVLEAAVIAVPHPRWQERPLACVVPKPEFRGQLAKQEILDYLTPRVAKWWLPDDVAVHRRGAQDLRGQVRQEGAPREVQGLDAGGAEAAPRALGLSPALRRRLALCGRGARSVPPARPARGRPRLPLHAGAPAGDAGLVAALAHLERRAPRGGADQASPPPGQGRADRRRSRPGSSSLPRRRPLS